MRQSLSQARNQNYSNTHASSKIIDSPPYIWDQLSTPEQPQFAFAEGTGEATIDEDSVRIIVLKETSYAGVTDADWRPPEQRTDPLDYDP